MQDFRHAFPVLRQTPVVTAAAILTLALGVGGNTAVFSVVNAVVLRGLYRSDPIATTELRELNDLNFARFEAKLEAALGVTKERVARLLADQCSDLMKWMFIFWAGAVLAIVGSTVALFTLFGT